jgi:hypothetical protein
LEGPAVDRQDSVYFTDIINERIMKLGGDGTSIDYDSLDRTPCRRVTARRHGRGYVYLASSL